MYCTIFTAGESSLEKDLLWTGSDDGLIHVSKNGGQNWENVTPAEAGKWMMWNSVESDPFKKGTAYFVGTKYKLDDFTPYIFKTEAKKWLVEVTGLLHNRVQYAEAIKYYIDLTPEEEKEIVKQTAFVFQTGKRQSKQGRPTKKQKRELDDFME